MLFRHLFCRQAIPAFHGSFRAGGKRAKLLLSHLPICSLSSLSLRFLLHVCLCEERQRVLRNMPCKEASQ